MKIAGHSHFSENMCIKLNSENIEIE